MRFKEWIKQHYRIILIGLVLAAVIFAAVFVAIRLSGKKTEITPNGAFPVRINEILTSNGSYPNSDGLCCDFIELYNDSNGKISLDGCQLSDRKSGERFVIPENTVIAPHGYLLINCSKDETGGYYAAFGLSKNGGEDIYFLDPDSVVIETVRTIAADRDVSQGYDDTHAWGLLPCVTPGYPNTPEGFESWKAEHSVSYSSDVRINEIMTSNTIYHTVGGECTDWIELFNTSDAQVLLAGYGLSDGGREPVWQFPEDAVLEAGAYLVVPCSRTGEEAAPFGLSRAGGEDVILFHADGTVADKVSTVAAEQNQSYARMEDGSWTLTFDATPGYPNTPEGREALVRSTDPQDVSVHITEIMASNRSICADATGLFHDWVELSNSGDVACDLSGWFLSDDADDLTQWKIPSRVLNPGESLVVFFAKNRDGEIGGELFAPMALSAAGDAVCLVDPLGRLIEKVEFGPMDENKSLVIDPETGEQTVCVYPTPGFPNTTDGYAAFAEQRQSSGAIAIWEVMTANDAYLSQSGEYYDWLEIKNISSEPVDLSAYSISDDSKRSDRYVLPDVTLQPGELYVLILSGHPEYSTKYYAHASFALNAQEDSLFLFGNGELIDYVRLYRLPYHNSYGRTADGAGGFFYMDPTPGKENKPGVRMISAEPIASVPSGVYNDVSYLDVTLSAAGTIYYTTDCSDPDRNANLYTGPIRIDRTTVLRSVSYEQEKKESRIVTMSYLIGEQHDLPIVSLATDPEHLWGTTGIYVDSVNRKEIEHPASAAYFGPDGSWATECGIKIHGVTSLMTDKKSFTLKFSGVYDGPLHYDIFGDGAVTVFKSVLLRSDVEGRYSTFMRDDLMHRIAKQYSPTMLSQNSKYVVLYLNGQYWGIYAIREQYTPFFYASNMGFPEDTVTVRKKSVRAGITLYDALKYIKTNGVTTAEDYAYIAERLDMSSLIDWAIFEAYCGNTDIVGNIRYMYSTADGKWRIGLVDVDRGFFHMGMFNNVYDAPQFGMAFRTLLRNETFRGQFLNRMAELLKTGLSEQNVTEMIDRMAGEIRSEIPNEIERWGAPRNWEGMVEELRQYARDVKPTLINGIRRELGLTDEEISAYFGTEGN